MTKLSRPMKLIALRIDEQEKARLEQLAEERDVTLSRALREGAAMYLSDLRAKGHKAKGGNVTFLGIRRDANGRALNEASPPTKGQRARMAALRGALLDEGIDRIRGSWGDGSDASVALGAAGQWLSVLGHLYVSNASEVGWQHFMRDYCPLQSTPGGAAEAARQIRTAFVRTPDVDVTSLLDSLRAGFVRLLDDLEHQELVRHAVLPAWQVLERDAVA
jgi:hypothetical protein